MHTLSVVTAKDLGIPVVQNRIPIEQPPAVLTKFPRYAYYQGAADVAPIVVKDEAAAIALGEEWGPFPFTTDKIDRTPEKDLPGLSLAEVPLGTEFPCYFYNQRARNAPPKIVYDPIAAENLGKDWGTLPYSDERFELLKELDAKEAELAAQHAKQAEADAKLKAEADAKAAVDAKAAREAEQAKQAQAEADAKVALQAKLDAEAKAAAKAPIAPPINVPTPAAEAPAPKNGKK